MQAHKKQLIIDVHIHSTPLQRIYNWFLSFTEAGNLLKPFEQNKKGHLHTSKRIRGASWVDCKSRR
jgi:hypothetical protein